MQSSFPTQLPALPSMLLQHTFSRYDLIPMPPNVLLRIEQGTVRTMTWSEEGTMVTLGYWGNGDVVGQPLSSVQPYQVECLTSVEVSYIFSHQWHQALDAIFLHVQQTEELFSIARCERVHQRLQQILFWLARKFGRPVEQGQLINLRLTHQELAEVIGTTRVTVTRLLSRFEQQGIIRRSCRHFIVLPKNFKTESP
ncbi:Crp/Fnr family transcriptional regulator [Chroococcidiopsis sp. CCMEE 29]|uniref:Crp/Fnr family transcriptional regulator n=1 Tax=Chroococcidiopsis sp. CCMEE 29 TaxID=155894 RepID=UPI0020227F4A|nr:Crp/Fnr family transcriptional regulator [Chroococcidiopsis sp. CCMEE 29]